jgi:MFS family permease
MIQFDDTKEMERRASVCYGDGLLDIGIGLGLLFLGFVMIFGLGVLAAIFMAVLFPIVKSAKRSITVPRMHHLDFMSEPEAEPRLHRIKAVVAVSMIVLLSLGVLAFLMSRMIPARISTGLRDNAIIIFGVMLAALFVFIAWGTVTKRLRVYAAITILALVCGYWFDLSPTWYFMILGAVIAIWGGTVLSRFLRMYPKMIDRNGQEYYSRRAALHD